MSIGLKTLLASVICVLSVGLVGAPIAEATYDQELTGTAATISGSQVTVNVITTISGSLKCEEVSYTGNGIGTMVEPTTGTTTYAEVTVHPKFAKCRHAGLLATVTTDGCNFVFTTATTTETAVTGFDAHAALHIECEPGKKIIINAGAGGCVGEIGEQTPSGVVDFKNEANGHILWQWTITGIAYHEEGLKCVGGTQNRTDGTLTGTVDVSGKNPNNGNAVKLAVT